MNTSDLAAVAAALGGTFESTSAGRDAPRGVVTLPDGVRFYMSVDAHGHKGKVRITTIFPHHVMREDGSTRATSQRDFAYNSTYYDGIGVSTAKSPERIARDIQSRFLPVFLPMHAKAVAWCEQQATFYRKKGELSQLADNLLKPFGYSNKNVQARVAYNGADYVRVEVDNLDGDKLRKLAAFLHTL